MSESDQSAVLQSLSNIHSLNQSIQQLNKLLARTRSASCSSIKCSKKLQTGAAFSKKSLAPLSTKNSVWSTQGSLNLFRSSKILSSSSLLQRKLGRCRVHQHHNCQACRHAKKQQRKQQVGDRPVTDCNPATKKRSQTFTKILVVNKQNAQPTIALSNLIQMKGQLEQKLLGINEKLRQRKSCTKERSFLRHHILLGSLKQSIRGQFSKLREDSAIGNFSFEEPIPTG